MWHCFVQNNSGGNFRFSKEKGISHIVLIEGTSIENITERAERIGLYFDGSGDCRCCGNRWYEPYNAGDAEPLVYGESYKKYKPQMFWMTPNPEGFIHPLKGKFKALYFGNERKR
jgi:hypothetical protein